jgi:hypothetical protein
MPRDIIEKATEFSRDFEVEPKLKEGVTPAELLTKTIAFLEEEVRETEEAIHARHLPNLVDGFGDVAFIALNGIYKTCRFEGFSHEEAREAVLVVMDRICTANLGKKQADGTIRYVSGKVIKPEGWRPPEYDDLFAREPQKA